METHVIDDLLSDLQGQINVANPEVFRRDVLRLMRRMMRQKIGLNLIGHPFTEQVDVIAHELKVPDYLLKLEDLSFNGYDWVGFKIEGVMQTTATLAFTTSPFGFRLPNYRQGRIYAKGLGLPKDTEGNTLIPDAIYDALVQFCLGNLLQGHYQHPLFMQRMAILAGADRMIDEARVELNQSSDASNRTMRHATGQYRNNIDPTFFN